MLITFARQLLLWAALWLAQALALNYIHLFGCATPMLYVYMATSFRHGYPRWAALLWCFTLGLAVDSSAGTPGLAAASMTLLAWLAHPFFSLFIQKDDTETLRPCPATMGWGKYLFYMTAMVAVYCTAYFSLEIFSYSDYLLLAKCAGGSAAVTLLLVLTVETLRTDSHTTAARE